MLQSCHCFYCHQHFIFLFQSQDTVVQPSLVIVYFGGNDSMGPHPSGLGPHVPLPEYIDNMRKIATHIQVFQKKLHINICLLNRSLKIW